MSSFLKLVFQYQILVLARCQESYNVVLFWPYFVTMFDKFWHVFSIDFGKLGAVFGLLCKINLI